MLLRIFCISRSFLTGHLVLRCAPVFIIAIEIALEVGDRVKRIPTAGIQ